MDKLIVAIFILLFTFKANSSSLFAPDGDTALLIELLGAEVQAVEGILQIVEMSSKTVDKMTEVHNKVADVHTRAVQAQYYAKTLVEFPKTLDKLRSMSSLRNNLYGAKQLFNGRHSLTLGYDILKVSSEISSERAETTTAQSAHDRTLAMRYLRQSFDSSKTGEGAVIGARASALSAVQLSSINNSIGALNSHANAQAMYLYIQEVERLRDEYNMKHRWGMIPSKMTFAEYSGISGQINKEVK
jgi:hypothetical protein